MDSSSPRIHVFCVILFALCFLVGATKAEAQQGKVLAGFFEEWSIYGANYNIADLQANGVASHLSHFIYAFANVTPALRPVALSRTRGPTLKTPVCPPPEASRVSGRYSAISPKS